MTRAYRTLHTTSADFKDASMTVGKVMRTNFRSANRSTPAPEALRALHVSGCPVLPVTRAQVPVGTVTLQSLALALMERGGDLSGAVAADIMSEPPSTIASAALIEAAVHRLAESGGPLLAVDGDGQLMGIVTLTELASGLSEGAVGRLVGHLIERREGSGSLLVDDASRRPAFPATGATEGHEADPTAEIQPTKAQAQPHPWDSPTGECPAPIPLVAPSDLVNPMLTVADIMTTGARTCSTASTVLEAAMIFREAGCGFVPVVDAGRPAGVLTDRDVALALAVHESDLAITPVERLMTMDVVTIDADASLDEAMDRLGRHGVRRLPVVDEDGQLVGVLSWTDLVPHVSERGLGHAACQIAQHR